MVSSSGRLASLEAPATRCAISDMFTPNKMQRRGTSLANIFPLHTKANRSMSLEILFPPVVKFPTLSNFAYFCKY